MIWYWQVSKRKAAAARSCGWRAAIAALLLAAATGCAAEAPPEQIASARVATGSAIPKSIPGPAITADALVAADGVRLPLRRWLPRREIKAVILALHGFNDYSNAFAMPAALWAERGIATYAYDQRGFGGAPLRRRWAGSARLAGDAVMASRLLRAIYPGRPIYLLGESMGGAIAVLAATGTEGVPPAAADGVILSAPAVWGRATMDLWPRLALFAAVRFVPELTLTGRGLDIKPSDNLPMLKALIKDPMVIKGSRVATIYGLVDLMDLALEAAPRLDMPVLLMYGARDEVVPREALVKFVGGLPPDPADTAGRRRLAYYQHGYHLLLRDLEGAVVTGDVANWVLDRRAPLPSQADRRDPARVWPPEKQGRS
jgi:alpha-beta hydrolase superfamily lysophospholipase